MSTTPERHQRWHHAARAETETKRLDRNWSSLLRASGRTDRRSAADWVSADIAVSTALRPSRRHHTGDLRATVSCSVAATLTLVAPVAMHRLLFRYHRPGIAVSAAHRLAYAGLVLLGVALLGVTVVVFEVVYGRTPATLAGGVVLVSFPAETRQPGPPRPTAPYNPDPSTGPLATGQ